MDFKDAYPDYVAIEEHIRRARVERSLALAQFIADAVDGAARGLRRVFAGPIVLQGKHAVTFAREPAAR